MKKIITTSIITLLFTLDSFSQRVYEEQAFKIGIESVKNFRDFLLLKNDANYKTEMEPLINWGINNFQEYGFKVERLETPELPLLLASKIISKNVRTLLIYLQFDGQPVDNSKWNQEDPYKAVLKENINGDYSVINWNSLNNLSLKEIKDRDIRIFARSASDAKGPVMMILNALEIMKRNNLNLKYNVKIITT